MPPIPVTARGFDVPPFAAACLDAAADAWAASFTHPFVVALADGSLDPARFRAYQMQDARYLEAFADAAALIATRCPDPADKLWFLDAARGALVVERALHEGYGLKLGYDAAQIAALTLTPNNRAYQDHMTATAQRGSVLEAIAAIAPCPWLYRDLGAHLAQRLGGPIPDDHPYADWLRAYADPSLDAYMQQLLGLLQRAADATPSPRDRARALDAFLASARYEWMFWEQAWTLQPWPV